MSLFQKFLALMLFGAVLVLALGFPGFLHPVFDTLGNFRLHVAAGLMLLAALLFIMRMRRLAVVAEAVALLAILTCRTGLPVGQAEKQDTGSTVHSVFVMNLLWNNREQDKVLQRIAHENPDFLILTEVSKRWKDNLAKLEAAYPYRYHCAEWRTVGGSVIFSRMKLVSENFCGSYASLGLATFEVDGLPVDFGVVHLRWPWPASGPRQITAIRPKLQETGPDAFIAGDFNSVTWSHSVQRFAEAGNLQIVGGIGSTWGPGHIGRERSYWFPAILGLPIDNVMRKGRIRVLSAQRLERAGSDHLPILVKFTVEK
ncbi:MAG: endonuclease/exonuclease/phosphatase family protein [Nitratireductor sp.]